MTYFEQYTSNTIAGSGNQVFFSMNETEIRTGRLFYKIAVAGEYAYSLLFSNTIDSTYDDGAISRRNQTCGRWEIHSTRIGICNRIDADKEISQMRMADEGENQTADILISDWKHITFDGHGSKTVMPGEWFSTDPITLRFDKDAYLCLEMTFSGSKIPYHEETLLPVFIKTDNGWEYQKQMPFASMIGCDRPVKATIAFLGDSITQGVGTAVNSYAHWNAILSQKLGDDYAFWNLGIGFGRANDAATDGAWLFKAKQSDIVAVCFGVNDILKGLPEDRIRDDLTTIVNILKAAGKTVILQTIPPFDYQGEDIAKWKRLNTYIRTVLKDKADRIFDIVPYISESDEFSHIARYGGHPNAEGCRIWANALYEPLKALLLERGF